MNSLVSIIVPVYNTYPFLEKCLNSLINQSYKNIEIILINDGSTDKSLDLCRKFERQDSRIIVVDCENHGVSFARNQGIQMASGEFICFVDSDDYVMNDYVDYLYGLIKKYNVDVALTKEFYTSFDKQLCYDETVQVVTGREAKIDILTYKIPIGVYCKIFKRAFLIKNNIKFEQDLVIGEGFNFNTFAFQYANKVAMGHKKVYFYRRNNPQSVTTNFSGEKWKNGLYAIEKISGNNIFNDSEMLNAIKFAKWHTSRDVVDLMLVAKSKKQNLYLYKDCRKICKRYWNIPFKVKAGFKERIRAFFVLFFPHFIPFLMRKRLKKEISRLKYE